MRVVFDRGTLMVLGGSPRTAATLPGVVWDPRVRGFRAPAYRYRDIRRVLRRAGVEHTGLRGGARLGPVRHPELRDYQRDALAAWLGAGRRGLVILPTGAGKTVVGMAAIASVGLPSLCIVPTRVLLHQWTRALEAALGREVGVLGDGRRTIRPVTVATHASAWRRMDRLGARFSLLVVDEAHHFGNGMADEALEMSAAPYRLGLTATPPTDVTALERLRTLIGPVVHELHVDDLAGTHLASYEQRTLGVELTPDERAAYEREVAVFRPAWRAFSAGDPSATWAAFVSAAGRTDAGRRALAALRRSQQMVAFPRGKRELLGRLLEKHADRRVLVFTADNATAYEVARTFLIHPITCDIGAKERDEVLARFRRGEVRALVSSRVLNEGLDVPDAEIGIILGGRLGGREHVQRIGRVLRPAAGKHAIVYELVVQGTSEVWASSRRRQALASP